MLQLLLVEISLGRKTERVLKQSKHCSKAFSMRPFWECSESGNKGDITINYSCVKTLRDF